MPSTLRTIQPNESIRSIWEELVYTLARLQRDVHAADQAPIILDLLTRAEALLLSQLGCWRAEIVAQAAVDGCDDEVDETVDAIDDALLAVVKKDRSSPRYRRYFAKPKQEILRLGLESEIARIREWPASLKTEPEPELEAGGERLQGHLAAGELAVQARSAAIAATADHRVRQILKFQDDVNGLRRSLFGLLTQRAVDQKLPPEWPGRFFRKSTHSTSKKAE
jgi:hypothetical protein